MTELEDIWEGTAESCTNGAWGGSHTASGVAWECQWYLDPSSKAQGGALSNGVHWQQPKTEVQEAVA